MPDPRVLLVSMPWANLRAPCPALGVLRPTLEQAGLATDTLYGTLRYPRSATDERLMQLLGLLLFVPFVHPETTDEALAEAAIRVLLDEHIPSRGLPRHERVSAVEAAGLIAQADALRAAVPGERANAAACLERCLRVAADPVYDVVGFSLLFDSQLAASRALAQRLRSERATPPRVVFGGAACVGDRAEAMLASFPEVDVVCHTEGEGVIVPLVQALRGERPLAEVPGIAYREGGHVHRTAPPPLLEELDALPLPAYDDYFAQLAASAWHDEAPELFFEASRGCWWAEKKPCRFCGMHASCRPFRSKSAARVEREIVTLHRAFPSARHLMATDNVLALDSFDQLLPRLAELGPETLGDRPLRLFWEVRPNLRREQVVRLRRAGVHAILVGIESFDDDLLRRMNKGTSALQNVQVLKWAAEQGMHVVYNLLVRLPGESRRSYEEMTELVPTLSHLPPPNDVHEMVLMRDSVYFARPEAFRITHIRPKRYYETLFPGDREARARLAHNFSFRSPGLDAEAPAVARTRLAAACHRWRASWRPDRAYCVEHDDEVWIVDARGPKTHRSRLTGWAAALFRFLDRIRTRAVITERFSELEPALLDATLLGWRRRRWLCRDGRDRHLAVLPRRREARR